MSESAPAPKADPAPYILAGLVVVLVMFGGLGTWAAVAPLSRAVVAPGVVAFHPGPETLRHPEGGAIAEILVRDGDLVESGDLLIRLDDRGAKATLAMLDQRLAELKQRIHRLEAERDAVQRLEIPTALTDAPGPPGYSAEPRSARWQALRRRIAILAEFARSGDAAGEAEFRFIEITQAFGENVERDLQRTRAEIVDLEAPRIAAEAELRRAEMRAPRSGRVAGADLLAAGGMIGPGQAILDIQPVEPTLVVEARVAPEDVDGLSDAQTAVVRLSAFDRATTPEVTGTVFMARSGRMVDQVSGTPYYLFGVRVPDGERAKLEDLELIPGMPAEVFIRTGERTALSYLLKPLTDGFARAFKDD